MRRAARWLVLLLGAGALASSLVVILPAALADAHQIKLRWTISRWLNGEIAQPTIVEIGAARNVLTDALKLTPDDPLIYENRAHLYFLSANKVASLPDLYQQFMLQARDDFRRAVALRPMSAVLWANIALADNQLALATPDHASDFLPGMWDAFDRAQRYGEREPSVQRMLAAIGFGRWDELGADRQKALASMVKRSCPQPDQTATKCALASAIARR